jgi:hypothetical protein
MNMEGNMKKEKLFKNKKRGQGFAEYALLAGGIIIIVGIALFAMQGIFDNVGNYIRCLLRVATAQVAGAGLGFGGCNRCLTDGEEFRDPDGNNLCN